MGEFFGEFLEYDHKNNTSIWREFMRIKVRLDVRKPLKRKKKIIRRNGEEVIVSCKYERLGDFCFTCGIMSHTERYWSRFLNRYKEEVVKEWGSRLQAPTRRGPGMVKSKWLREDGDADWEVRQGRGKGSVISGEGRYDSAGNQVSQRRGLNQQLVIGGGVSYPINVPKSFAFSEGRRV